MKDMLYAVLALISAIVAALSIYKYTNSADEKLYLVGFIVFLIGALLFGVLFMAGRVNKKEDIHITE